ncbi:uncharacterized protein BJ212DRAFT_1303711 [Suillus subaureus]|uniref:Uncharacterized protein n=1 Tax=Suillus subaureus TaxID=48587 RepID=A0A9P7DY10_9AGAM|nr:uncharacterized protein BJ212DRAFT_1303711 [Suillus subaureus]KAG1806194.1 hypothetical protein BJ212DRAFT_1303711 [Suillus subaureus]
MYKKMHNHRLRVKGPVHKTLVAKWVETQIQAASTSSIQDESEDKDKDRDKDKDAEDRMYEEDNIDDSLLVPANENYKMDLSSPLENMYTQLTFPESSPPAIPVTQYHPDSQDSYDQGVRPSHWQLSMPVLTHHRVQSSTEDNSIEITAPPPSQFIKINPKVKPIPAWPKTVLAKQISALEAYKLYELDSFENWDNASPIVPRIPYQDGFMCTFQGCCFATILKQCIQAHDREYCTCNNWKSCVV